MGDGSEAEGPQAAREAPLPRQFGEIESRAHPLLEVASSDLNRAYNSGDVDGFPGALRRLRSRGDRSLLRRLRRAHRAARLFDQALLPGSPREYGPRRRTRLRELPLAAHPA